ncbi:MAG: response regulator [Bacteroidales bacterium]|nr:MAG: response regulator [Bacteroidales bacterium]
MKRLGFNKINRFIPMIVIWNILGCILSINLSFAQDNDKKFIRLFNNQDIPLRITAICQDKNGLMWFGSMAGLYQYDGYKLTAYKNIVGDSSSLSNNYINVVFKDKAGDIWVGTWGGGLNKFVYETKSFIRYSKNSLSNKSYGLIGDVISAIFEDKTGNLWVGTYDDGLYMLDAHRKTVVAYKYSSENLDGISNDQINALAEDINGNIIVSTRYGLNVFNPALKKFIHFLHDPNDPNSLSDNIIGSICFDKEQRLWIGTRDKLNVFKLTSNKLININDLLDLPKKLYKSQIGLIKLDNAGNIWLSTVDGYSGLYCYNSTESKLYNYTNIQEDKFSISDNIVNTFFEDKLGIIWFGTINNGCFFFDDKLQKVGCLLTRTLSQNTLNNVNAIRLYVDKIDNLWFTNNIDGLISIDINSKKISKINPFSDANSPNIITEISEGTEGNLWISSVKGFFNVDIVSHRIAHFQNNPLNTNSLSSDLTLSILKDKKGILWIGTNGSGLNRFNPLLNKYNSYLHNPDDINSISSNSVYTLFEDSSDNLFVGTSEGLDEFDRSTGRFIHYIGRSDSLQSIIVLSIIESKTDKGKIFWIGTSKGLFRFNRSTKELKFYSEKNGMYNSFLSGMVDDNKGDLWLSTFDGLMRFNIKTETFDFFDITQGFPKDEYNVKSITKDRSGRIFLGGVNGIYAFNPDSFTNANTFPQTIITDFQLFNKPVPIGKSINKRAILEKSITETKEIKLTYLDHIFSLDFSSLDLRFPDKVQYAYMLEGFEKDWNYIGNRHFVTYTQLPHGEYTFKVKASYRKGDWGDSYTSLKITISPPWWKTKLFYIALPIVIILTLYSFIKIRERNLRLDKIRLERTILERTKDLSEANTQLEEHQAELEIKQEEITAQAELLENTNKELEKLSIVASETDNAVIIMDAQTNFEWVNEGFIRMFCDIETLRERGASLITASPKENIRGIVNECLESKKTVNYQTYNTFNSGKHFWTQTTLTPIVNSLGDIVKLIAIDSDITKLKEAELEIISQKNELEIHRNHLEEVVKERTIELKISRDKAEESDRLKSAFLANMSHEIRTPMNAIIGFSNLLISEDISNSDRNEFIKYIINNSNTLLHLIDDIIDISKIEAGQLRISIKPCSLNKMMFELHENFNNKKNSSSNQMVELKLIVGVTDPEFTIQVDSLRIKQVLSNLVDNALKFTESGVVELGYFLEGGIGIKFYVKDTGIGMSESQLGLIFNRFTKIEDDKSRLYRGAGLGLSICKSLVNLMGGDIYVESEPNVGTIVYFTIPLIKGTERDDSLMMCEELKDDYSWVNKNILIAEDEENNFQYLKMLLRASKVNIIRARNGREALTLFAQNKSDLILMDIKMPIMDGVKAAQLIRKENKVIPIIALSAYAFNQEIEDIRKEGFNEYLVKPINPSKLLALLDKYFNAQV